MRSVLPNIRLGVFAAAGALYAAGFAAAQTPAGIAEGAPKGAGTDGSVAGPGADDSLSDSPPVLLNREDIIRLNREFYRDREELVQESRFGKVTKRTVPTVALSEILPGFGGDELGVQAALAAAAEGTDLAERASQRLTRDQIASLFAAGARSGRSAGASASPAGGPSIGDIAAFGSPQNAWPGAVVYYEFSAAMVTQFFALGSPTPPVEGTLEFNQAIGVPNFLAAALLIEQVTDIQFVGDTLALRPSGPVLFIDTVSFPGIGDGTCTNVVEQVGAPLPAAGGARAPDPMGFDATDGANRMQHCTWDDLGSVIRQIGFVLGLQWEQRRPDRDQFIEFQPQNIAPSDFLGPQDSLMGVNGLLLYDIIEDEGVAQTFGPYDQRSIMHLGPFEVSVNGLPVHIFLPELDANDIDGDGDFTEPNPLNDPVFPEPFFFSDGDLAALEEIYDEELMDIDGDGDVDLEDVPWSFGENPNCPVDINRDLVQDPLDLRLFIELFRAQDITADVNFDGFVNNLDIQVFLDNIVAGFCSEAGAIQPGIRPGTVPG